MYTRSRQSNQNFNAGQQQRQPNTPNAQGGNFQNQAGQNANSFSQQGNYQTSQSPRLNQQGNFKPGNVQQFKGQQQQTPLQQQANQVRMQQQQQQQQQVKSNPQLQHQQIQQQLKQQQQQQQQPAPGTPQGQRLKPILKQTPTTPAATPQAAPQTPQTPQAQVQQQAQAQVQQQAQVQAQPPIQAPAAPQISTDLNNDSTENAEGMEVSEQPRWRRKTPGLKVNRKLKRLRMNQRLRRTLQPKNAIMVLNEMKTGVQFTFPETQSSLTNSLFLVHAEIDGKTYVGQGLSKPLARQNAAENALKCLLLEKMTAASMKARIDAESDGQTPAVVESAVQNDENNESIEKMETTSTDEPDEIPWSSLASFALYKLFVEWQNQGTVVPVPRPGVSPGRVKRETKPTVQKELPANAISVHPVMLLNQMRPGLTYQEVNRVGNPPNTMFTLGVDVDGVEYTGTAKNKKDAKKITAKAALNALFGLAYPEEAKVDHSDDIQMS